MATQVTTSLPLWLAGCTYDGNGGNDLRNSGVAAFFFDEGIVTGNAIGVLGGVIGGAGLVLGVGTGMNITVQPGSFVVPNSTTPTAGGYVSTLPSLATLSVQTADPSNPRIDIVVAFVSDVGSSSSFGAVEIITGTAAATPVAPSAPANSIILGQLTIPAGTTVITSGMIADKRPFTTATGGILVAPKGSVTGYLGQIAYDKASGSFYHNNNTSNQTQLHVLPWQPVITKLTASVSVPGDQAVHSVCSATFTTDGYTDVEVFFKCPAIFSATSSSSLIRAEFLMYIDGTLIDTIYSAEVNADTYWQAGVSWSYYTSSATADTPAAGTHTCTIKVQNTRSNLAYSIAGTTASNILLRVEPVGK